MRYNLPVHFICLMEVLWQASEFSSIDRGTSISAEEDIRKTLARFANSFDLKNRTLMESALAEELTVDYSDLRGEPTKAITAREYAQARREALEALDTQHIIDNLEITIEGKRASVKASSMIFRSLDGVVFNTHARYHFRMFQDQDRGWVIDRIKQTVLWNEGDPDIHRGVKK